MIGTSGRLHALDTVAAPQASMSTLRTRNAMSIVELVVEELESIRVIYAA